jgi:hypothetical protein
MADLEWIFVDDWRRVGQNSTNLLGVAIPDRPIRRILERSPTQAPAYLILSGQNGTAKLFRLAGKLKKIIFSLSTM